MQKVVGSNPISRFSRNPAPGRDFVVQPADDGPVPGEIIEHRAHAVGHAAILLAGDLRDDGVEARTNPCKPRHLGPRLRALLLSMSLAPLIKSGEEDQRS